MSELEHRIEIDEDLCTGCGICVEYCHVDAIAVSPERGVIEVVDLGVCIECHSCQQNCPQGAIRVYPQIDEAVKSMGGEG
jgi:ferredoxin